MCQEHQAHSCWWEHENMGTWEHDQSWDMFFWLTDSICFTILVLRAVLAAMLDLSVLGADLRLRTPSSLFWTAAATTSLSSCELNRSGRRVLAPVLISMVSSAQTKIQARRTRTYRKVYPWYTSKSPTCTHTQSTWTCSMKGAPYVGEHIRCKTNYHCWLNNQLCKLWAAAGQTELVYGEQDK